MSRKLRSTRAALCIRVASHVFVVVCAFAALAATLVWAREVEPRIEFSPAQEANADDSRWRAGFHEPGLEERVFVLSEYRGELIAGGMFKLAGSTPANLIARYDGLAWKTLGSGVGGVRVDAVTTYEDRLIVGGFFTEAGDAHVRNIASWDGTSWEPVGGGFDGYVFALCVYRGTLFAGGTFSEADGNPAPGIAMWDGSAWQGLSTGVSGGLEDVEALAVYGDHLVIAGSFTSFAGVQASNIVAWDGERGTPLTSEWLGQTDEGTSGTVEALAVFDGLLVAGGVFNNAAGRPVNKIAAWDGARWKNLAGGVLQGSVQSLAVHDGRLVVGGSFDTAGAEWDGVSWRPGVIVNNIAEWDGVSWRPLAGGTSSLSGFLLPNVYAIASFQDDLFIGGAFLFAGEVYTRVLARWDGTTWHAIDPGDGIPPGFVFGVTVYNGKPAAGGAFLWAGRAKARRIALWNSTSWEALGSGIDSMVTRIDIKDFSMVTCALPFEGDLVVGGRFSYAGETPASHIARWDGQAWHPMGEGFDATVWDLVQKDGVLYAGGEFGNSGSNRVDHVARWNGAAWEPLGFGLDDVVLALCVHRDTLVAGGVFFHSGSTPVRTVAQWDGAAWQPLGSGLNMSVHTLASFRGDLIAGGSAGFWTLGMPEPLARWNGSAWEGIFGASGAGILEVNALQVLNGKLFAGGLFRQLGGTDASNVARWDGTTWSALGSGTNNTVHALSSLGGSLLVGGQFSTAGDRASSGFAIWDEAPVDVTVQDLRGSRTDAGISLEWRLGEGTASELIGIRVQRAEQADGSFETRSSWLVPRLSMVFLDEDADPSVAYLYRLALLDRHQAETTSGLVLVEPNTMDSGGPLLHAYQAGEEVRIRYRIASGPVPIALEIYDVKGRRIAILERGVKEPGEYSIRWDSRDENGIAIPRGLYFVRLEANGFKATSKLLRLGP